MKPGDAIPELRTTPDRFLTVRYAGASGDFNPIHIDEEFARQVGLPGRILHGLWTMAQVARAHSEALGGPDKLERQPVQRACRFPGYQIRPVCRQLLHHSYNQHWRGPWRGRPPHGRPHI